MKTIRMTPYPSRLIVGCYKGRLIHVVAADNFDDEEIIVITVYEPAPSEWYPGLQEEDLMKCVICKKASTKPRTTTVTFERGCLTMVVKCVPAQVCPNCGEAYINEKPQLSCDAEERASTGRRSEDRQDAVRA